MNIPKKPLTQSVIKKIQMVKLLYDLGNDCFQAIENPEKIGAGIVLLQDSTELFLIATCEHLDISLEDHIVFDKYFVKLKEKIGEEIPLKKQMLLLNKQRINIKHYGFLPHIDNCKNFPDTVKTFFMELSTRYMYINFESITLVDLLKEGEIKELLKQAETYLKSGDYKNCQISCRKALYLTFEKGFDIRPFEKEENPSHTFSFLMSCAPSFAKNKRYIEEKVKDPTDYIVYDSNELEKDLLLYGTLPMDFWNIWRITPQIYYYEDSKEWIIKDQGDEFYNKDDAEYCFRKTIDLLLCRQRYAGQEKYSKTNRTTFITTRKKIRVFEKASLNSTVKFESEDGPYTVWNRGKIRGLDDKKYYFHIVHIFEKENKKIYLSGYIREDDIEI